MSFDVENMDKKQLIEIIYQLEKSTSELNQKNNLLSQENQYQKYIIEKFKRMLFGTKRERFTKENPYQMNLPFEEDQQSEQKQDSEEKQTITYQREKPKKREKKGIELPEDIEVEEIRIEPEEDVSNLKYIGEDVTKVLEFTPAKLKLKKYIRPKYARENHDDSTKGIVMGILPSRPIEKSMASSSLLSHLLVSKYVDHLPIYRQIEMFKRQRIKIPPSTIDSWITQTANLLSPLYDRLKQKILSQGYLQADETPIKVLDKNKKQKTHQGYYWVYHAPLQNAVFFDYRKSRDRYGPLALLKNFKGYLQSDGYSVYKLLEKQLPITLVGCMAHARRKFYDALAYDKEKAEYVLEKIQKLYAIESQAKQEQIYFEEIKELRLDKALPIINELGKKLAEWNPKLLSKTPIGEAVSYAVNNWDYLQAYLNDGALNIDNNLIENAIRPNALGRKNYLFAGSHDAAQRAAMIYTFFGTCKMNNVNPYSWLKKVLDLIPEYSASKIEDLFPQNLKLD